MLTRTEGWPARHSMPSGMHCQVPAMVTQNRDPVQSNDSSLVRMQTDAVETDQALEQYYQ